MTQQIVLGVTGHRPDKLGGWKYYRPVGQQRLCDLVDAYVRALKTQKDIEVTEIVTGMAPGFDTGAALAAICLAIPFIAAVPFEGQHDNWKDSDQEMYFELLSQAKSVIYVSPPGYTAEKMLIRNRWIVDNSDRLCALWNSAGTGNYSGTGHCVRYADSQHKTIDNLWNSWQKFRDRPVCP